MSISDIELRSRLEGFKLSHQSDIIQTPWYVTMESTEAVVNKTFYSFIRKPV